MDRASSAYEGVNGLELTADERASLSRLGGKRAAVSEKEAIMCTMSNETVQEE